MANIHNLSQHRYSMGIDKSNSGSFSLNRGGSLDSSQFVMNNNSNVGIGTHKLVVEVTIGARQIKVEIGVWSDCGFITI